MRKSVPTICLTDTAFRLCWVCRDLSCTYTILSLITHTAGCHHPRLLSFSRVSWLAAIIRILESNKNELWRTNSTYSWLVPHKETDARKIKQGQFIHSLSLDLYHVRFIPVHTDYLLFYFLQIHFFLSLFVGVTVATIAPNLYRPLKVH